MRVEGLCHCDWEHGRRLQVKKNYNSLGLESSGVMQSEAFP